MTSLPKVKKPTLFDVLEARVGLPLHRPMEVELALKSMTVEPGNCLVRSGAPAPYIYLVQEGIFKLTFQLADGSERVRDFVSEGQIVACLESLETGLPAEYSIVAYARSKVQRLPYGVVRPLVFTDLAWSRCQAMIYYDTAVHRAARERDLLLLRPFDRFEKLAKERPGIAQRVPQQDLAAFVGVTPQSLSRLKSHAVSKRPDSRP